MILTENTTSDRRAAPNPPSASDAMAAVVTQTGKTTILVVDDAILDRRLAGRIIEKDSSYRVVYAIDGDSALEVIAQESPAAVVTDLQMPGMNGLQLVEEVRNRFPSTPVILMTGSGSEQIAVEALNRGAASYFPKPMLVRELRPTLHQVLTAARIDRSQQKLLVSMNQFECRFALENDPALIPPLVAYLQEHLIYLGLCDQTQRTRVGIALEESLLNGLHHGNLELSSDLRQDGSEAYAQLGNERRVMSPYRERRLHVHARLTIDQAVFVIRDEGPGFNFAALPDPREPANLQKLSGRGLMLIHTFMDAVTHNAAGNEITLVKRRESKR